MNDKRSDSPTGKKPGSFMTILVTALLVTFFINMLLQTLLAESIIRIPYSEFLHMVQSGYVERVEVQQDRLLVMVKEGFTPRVIEDEYYAVQEGGQGQAGYVGQGSTEYNGQGSAGFLDRLVQQTEQRLAAQASPNEPSRRFYTGRVENPDLVAFLTAHDVEFSAPVTNNNVILDIILQWVIPIAII